MFQWLCHSVSEADFTGYSILVCRPQWCVKWEGMQCFGKSNLRPVFVFLALFCNQEAGSKAHRNSLFPLASQQQCPTPTSNPKKKKNYIQLRQGHWAALLLSWVSLSCTTDLSRQLIGRLFAVSREHMHTYVHIDVFKKTQILAAIFWQLIATCSLWEERGVLGR